MISSCMHMESFSHFFDYSIEYKIKQEQRRQADKALKRFSRKHIRTGEGDCTLAQVRDALIDRGVAPGCCEHSVNDFRDDLHVNIRDVRYNLNIPLFPQKRSGRTIKFDALQNELHHRFEIQTAPEGIAEFILAVSEWIPEYYDIEERMMAEEKQRKMACDIALDALKTTIGQKLAAKGYAYDIMPDYDNKASLRIIVSDIFNMTFVVNLLEDFLEQVSGVVDSLPVNEIEDYSMINLKNIHNCVVIEDFDDALIAELKDGGNNVISHNGNLWIPNMSRSAMDKAEKRGYVSACYTSQDVLPKDAPMVRLKAVNAKLDQMLEVLDESQKQSAVQRIIHGVGYAGHYNRHRYKMPPEILEMEEGESEVNII